MGKSCRVLLPGAQPRVKYNPVRTARAADPGTGCGTGSASRSPGRRPPGPGAPGRPGSERTPWLSLARGPVALKIHLHSQRATFLARRGGMDGGHRERQSRFLGSSAPEGTRPVPSLTRPGKPYGAGRTHGHQTDDGRCSGQGAERSFLTFKGSQVLPFGGHPADFVTGQRGPAAPA